MTTTTPPDTETFNLRVLTRDVVRTSLVADPGLIADDLFARILPADYEAALQQALRHFVRQVLSEERSHPQIHSPAGPGVSAKRQMIADGWQRRLRDRLSVADGEWKFLGDCTAVDLQFAADYRREQAARNRAKAAQYDVLRHLLEERGAERVADLPAELLITTLGRAA
jgi:hypothetical protein